MAAQSGPAWDPPVNLSNSAAQSYTPAVAVDPSGVVHGVWAEESGDGRSFVAYSRFAEGRWSLANEIITSPISESVVYPALAVDSRGVLHLVWCGDGTLYYSQAYAPRANLAQSWSAPAALEYFQAYIGRPQLQVDAQGDLYLIYPIISAEESGIYLLRSTDQGQSWSEPFVIFRNDRVDRVVDLPQLAVGSDGSLHAVWVESSYPETFPPVGIRYARSGDGGETWSEPFALADGPYSFPAILARGPREVHIVYSGTVPDRYKFHRWSSDGGSTWLEIFRNTAVGGYQGLPVLVEDSAKVLHWLTTATVFSIKWDSVYHTTWQDGSWLPGEVVLRGEPVSQNSQDIVAGVVLGNELVAMVQAPIASGSQPDGWQYEIFALRLPLDAPHLQPAALALPTATVGVRDAVLPLAASGSAGAERLPPDSLSPAVSQSPLVPIGIGVLAAVAALGFLIFLSMRRMRS